MILLAILCACLVSTTVGYLCGVVVGHDRQRQRMISAFWAWLSHHAGYTTRGSEFNRLTPREVETFDDVLGVIIRDKAIRQRNEAGR